MTRPHPCAAAGDLRRTLLLSALAAGLGMAAAFVAAPARSDTPRGAIDPVAIRSLLVEEALATSRVPPSLALAVARVESNFRGDALSSAGARGVMQIMPATARGEYGVDADELWNPRLNIQLGIDFLDRLIARYGGRWDLALSHYNGGSVAGTGPGARPLTATREYVNAVLAWERRYREQEPLSRTVKAEPRDGWIPARTRIDNLSVTIRPAGPRPVERAAVAAPTTSASFSLPRGTALDDFDGGLEARRILARARLDDFSAVVRWTGG